MTQQQPHGPWRGQHPVPPAQPAPTAEMPPVAGPARPSWWTGLAPGPKAAVIVAAVILPFFLCCGGLTAIGALRGEPDGEAAPVASVGASPAASRDVPASPSPSVEIRTVTETEDIPFEEETVEDASLTEGTEEVRTEGAAGVRTLTYEVTYVDGVATERQLIKEEVTEEPVNQVVAIGTREEPEPQPEPEPEPEPEKRCDPNYGGACVPISSDVDCAGGSGNGPAYVRGPVTVIGDDIYDLDRDGDGIACDR